MINSIEDLRSAGVLPTGPVSAWPEHRNVAGPGMASPEPPPPKIPPKQATKVKATTGQMARGLLKNAAAAIKGGKVSAEIRTERFNTCKGCPYFIPETKRCQECGCFMSAKSWINADPAQLCPKQKWIR